MEFFKEECCKHNILCFVETSLDDTDIDWVTSVFRDTGYNVYSKKRHKVSVKRSGGILIAVARNLDSYVELTRTDCKIIQWLKGDKGQDLRITGPNDRGGIPTT